MTAEEFAKHLAAQLVDDADVEGAASVLRDSGLDELWEVAEAARHVSKLGPGVYLRPLEELDEAIAALDAKLESIK